MNLNRVASVDYTVPRKALENICSGIVWAPCDMSRGPGTSRVYDESKRVCEKADVKWTNFIDQAALLALMGFNQAEVRLEEEEILHYREGSFFKSHKDRLRGSGHVGTLLVVIPSIDLVGGELIVEKVALPPSGAMYIPLGSKHEVTNIEKGERIVLKAAVYSVVPRRTITEHGVEIDADTRIVLSTGLRMPTEEELREIYKLGNAGLFKRGSLARRNAIGKAKGEQTRRD